MLYLRSVEILQLPERAEFPFTLPLIQQWQTPIAPVAYGNLEHVGLTRDFLADPESFLRHL